MTTNDAAKRYCDYPCPFTEEGHANGMAGHTYEPSNPSTHDDADRLRGWFEIPFVGPEANEMLDAALAAEYWRGKAEAVWLPIAVEALTAERRATVERIRAEARRQKIYSPTWFAILDAEAER